MRTLWTPSGGAPSVDDAVDDRDQLLGIEGLHDPAGPAGSTTLVALVLAGFGGEDQDRQAVVFPARAHLLDELDAIHHRHVDVGDDDVDGLAGEDVEPLLAVLGLQHLEPGIGQGVAQHREDGAGVIDGENTHAALSFHEFCKGGAQTQPLDRGRHRCTRPGNCKGKAAAPR
mgnify:CR=1 FL=1